ncbi:MAG: hypothetical protein IH855_09690 [Bacteroidetes bacterium]|nr:hypothetical protein [Bacteroidota bacterium]
MARKKPRKKVIKLSEAEVPEFLRIVYDDLAFLRSLDFSAPSRTEVRFSSSVLRRLLHEHMLDAAWTFSNMEGEPRVEAVDLDALLGDVPRRYVHYAYAGGAHTQGAQHAGHVLLVVPRDEVTDGDYAAVTKAVSEKLRPGVRREFTLREFCTSPSVVSGSAAVSRVDVVRYVANKLGGVHWDNRRQAWTSHQGSRHRLLDEQHIVVRGLPGALFEIVSIAEAVVAAPDTGRLMEKIDQEAPEPTPVVEVLQFREGRTGEIRGSNLPSEKSATQSCCPGTAPGRLTDHCLTSDLLLTWVDVVGSASYLFAGGPHC